MKKLMMMALMLVATTLGAQAQEAKEDPDVKYAAELLKPGTLAPDFKIPLRDSVSQIPLSGLRGHYVVVEFWASWCPDCRKDMPQVKELYANYHDRGVAFVGVSFDFNGDAWRNYIKKNDLNWLHYSELKKWKKDTEIDKLYNVSWIPTYYVIDPDGRVVLGTVMVEKVGATLNKLYEEGFLKDSAKTLNKLLGEQ